MFLILEHLNVKLNEKKFSEAISQLSNMKEQRLIHFLMVNEHLDGLNASNQKLIIKLIVN